MSQMTAMNAEQHAMEQQLIANVVNNNCHRAFSELVKQHQSQLRYSLRQLTGWNEALADDLAQETFIKAYRALPNYRGDAKFSSWLYRIAHNQMISHYRKAANRPQDHQSEVPDIATIDPSDELEKDLAKALATLPPGQRMALHLLLHREYTQSEISDIMGIPLGTVKTHISRGKEQLRTFMSAWQPGESA